MDNLNIVVMGKTGAGKSTLINAILNEDLAPTGIGQAVTLENKVYAKNVLLPLGDAQSQGQYALIGKSLQLYDTVGLEVDSNVTQKTLIETHQFIQRAQQAATPHAITLVWFCINSQSNRFESFELELIKEMTIEYEIPFVIVITQCFSAVKGELEAHISDVLPTVPVVRILAKEYRSRGGSIESFGVAELFRRSILDYERNKVALLETKMKLLAYEKSLIIGGLSRDGKYCVKKYASKAKKIGYVPIACMPVVSALCVSMIIELNKIAGINFAAGFTKEYILNTIVGTLMVPFMAVPILSASAASSCVKKIGDAYLSALMNVIERSSDSDLKNNSLVMQRIQDEIDKRKNGIY